MFVHIHLYLITYMNGFYSLSDLEGFMMNMNAFIYNPHRFIKHSRSGNVIKTHTIVSFSLF